MQKKAYLVLENGKVFEGVQIGAQGEAVGELVFSTSMVGYLETLTDPGFFGQIVMQTFPLIGNYGVIESDFENKSAVSGYVVRECCETPSNFRSEYELDLFLKNNNICGISGVDTREVTRIIREEGVMNAKICSEIPLDMKQISEYKVSGGVEAVGSKEKTVYPAKKEKKYEVALIDYGTRKSVIDALCERGCEVTVLPWNVSAEDVLGMSVGGVLLSNGPGDPKENTYCIEQIKKLIGKIPVFGIGLGHQMTALAMGADTVKMKHGHTGGNQPVSETGGSRTYITTQNHGYAVDKESIKDGEINFVNANDSSCEGIEYPEKNCFTVQFYPDTQGSINTTSFLYDKFISMIGGNENA